MSVQFTVRSISLEVLCFLLNHIALILTGCLSTPGIYLAEITSPRELNTTENVGNDTLTDITIRFGYFGRLKLTSNLRSMLIQSRYMHKIRRRVLLLLDTHSEEGELDISSVGRTTKGRHRLAKLNLVPHSRRSAHLLHLRAHHALPLGAFHQAPAKVHHLRADDQGGKESQDAAHSHACAAMVFYRPSSRGRLLYHNNAARAAHHLAHLLDRGYATQGRLRYGDPGVAVGDICHIGNLLSVRTVLVQAF